MRDASLALEAASSAKEAAERAYDDAFRLRVTSSVNPAFNPTVRSSVETGRCSVCGSVVLRLRIPSPGPPRRSCLPSMRISCRGRVANYEHGPSCRARCGSLAGVQTATRRAALRVSATKPQLDAAQAEMDDLNQRATPRWRTPTRLFARGPELCKSGRVGETFWRGSINRRSDNALQRKAVYRERQREALGQLRSIQAELRQAFGQAESVFVPRFASFWRASFSASISTSVCLATVEGSVGLVLSIEGERRRSVDEMSESQRYFVDIALRMALAEHMVVEGAPVHALRRHTRGIT